MPAGIGESIESAVAYPSEHPNEARYFVSGKPGLGNVGRGVRPPVPPGSPGPCGPDFEGGFVRMPTVPLIRAEEDALLVAFLLQERDDG